MTGFHLASIISETLGRINKPSPDFKHNLLLDVFSKRQSKHFYSFTLTDDQPVQKSMKLTASLLNNMTLERFLQRKI